jgi:predicted transposase/invertase (TIGR01784 family)
MRKIKFTYEDDIINPCRDNVFKSVFTRNTPPSRGALTRLLSAYMAVPVELVTVTANEPPPVSLYDRQIRFDIAVKFNNGQLGNVEMTTSPEKYEALRFEYYVCRLFAGQDIKGTNKYYDDLQNTYQISLLGESLFKDHDLLHRFEYYDTEHNLSLGGKTTIITVEFSKTEPLLAKPAAEMNSMERWSVFFRYITDPEKRDLVNEIMEREEGITMASEVLLAVSRDEAERAALEHEYKNALDLQSIRVSARREGLVEGEAKGRQRLLESARILKTQGVSPEIIALATGLTPEDIENL